MECSTPRFVYMALHRPRTVNSLISKFDSSKDLFTWSEGAPANQATLGGLTSHTFL